MNILCINLLDVIQRFLAHFRLKVFTSLRFTISLDLNVGNKKDRWDQVIGLLVTSKCQVFSFKSRVKS